MRLDKGGGGSGIYVDIMEFAQRDENILLLSSWGGTRAGA
jgi:hypothetical protein